MKKQFFASIANAPLFHGAILFVIVLAAVLVGIETYAQIHEQYRHTFAIIDHLIQGIFTLEIIIRILAFGKQPLNFFKRSTNNIDFLITADLIL